MPWGKTDEEKQAEAVARAAQAQAQAAARAAQEQAKAEAAYWQSPVGQAAQAKQRGDRFFQTEIETSTLSGYASFASSDSSRTERQSGAGDLLGQIEALGWRLEHASWVFIETGMSSRDRMFSTGEQTMTSGRVEGIYLFRSVDDPSSVDPTVPRPAMRMSAGSVPDQGSTYP